MRHIGGVQFHPRWRADGKVLLLYAIIAFLLLSPFASSLIPVWLSGGDMVVHLTAVIEARDALVEGQFPLRIAPHTLQGTRYPFFQFYGNLPYSIAGLGPAVLGLSPYAALKLTIGVGLIVGAYFTYKTAQLLRRRAFASILAGTVFVTAPYLLTDIFARIAFPEVLSFCLLPLVLYASLRLFLRGRPSSLAIGASGVAWSALSLSHNITFLYASIFIAIFYVTFFRWHRRRLWRLVRVGGAYGLGLLLSLWYIVPQLTILSKLVVSTDRRLGFPGLSPLGTLLSPAPLTPFVSTTPDLRLQVGLPIVFGVGVVAYYALSRGVARFNRGIVIRLLVLFLLALLMSWYPSNTALPFWWKIVPSIFLNVQFPYRLLMFTVLWGALLAAYALTLVFRKGMTTGQFLASLLLLLMIGSNSLPSLAGPYESSFSLDLGKGGATNLYKVATEALQPYALAAIDAPDIVRANDIPYRASLGPMSYYLVELSRPQIVQLPELFYPGLLDVRLDGNPVPYGAVGPYVGIAVPPGEHRIRASFRGIAWANAATLLTWFAGGIAVGVECTLMVLGRRRRFFDARSLRLAVPGLLGGIALLVVLPVWWVGFWRPQAINAQSEARLELARNQGYPALLPSTFALNVTFSGQHAYPLEPILTDGKTGAGDFVYVRYVGSDRVVFAFSQWGGNVYESAEIPIIPGKAYRVDIIMDRFASVVAIYVDSRRVLFDYAWFHSSSVDEISLGENRIGGNLSGPRFSGVITVSLPR